MTDDGVVNIAAWLALLLPGLLPATEAQLRRRTGVNVGVLALALAAAATRGDVRRDGRGRWVAVR